MSPAARSASKPKPKPEPKTTAVAVVQTAVEPLKDRRAKIEAELVRLAPDIAATLPNNMSRARFQVVVLQALSRNPELLDCEASSVILSVLEAAQLGLEPTGSLSRAWLIPFKEKGSVRPKAQLMIGVRGYEDLARRSGEIADVWSRVVYEGDQFEVIYGTEDRIVHVPKLETIDPTKITHVYAVAKFSDGRVRFEVMTKADIDRIRARARGSNFGPWVTDYAEMSRKTCVRRLIKTLPLTVEAITAVERDEEREFGQPAALPAVSRTAEVRQLVLNRGKEPVSDEQAASEAPGAPETVEVAPDATPTASATQQTGAVEPEPVAQGDGQPVCGATSDPKLGAVETCVLEPEHLAVKGSAQRHQSAAGSVWPA
jgi:recombination protein RecT